MKINSNIVYSKKTQMAYDSFKGEFILTTEEESKLLSDEGNNFLQNAYLKNSLIKKGIIGGEVSLKAREKIIEHTVLRLSKDHGAIAIMPTEQCNFRCTYCYETFEKGKMVPPLVDSIIMFLKTEMRKYKNYDLSWFGGEPLICLDHIIKISKIYKKLQIENNIKGTISITTNGFLLNEKMIDSLKDISVDILQISLDGPKEVHDKQRVTIAGKDTYTRILTNIEKVLSNSNITVLVRSNVDSSNQKNLEITNKWIQETLVPLQRKFSNSLKLNIVPIWKATTVSVEGICLKESMKFQNWFTAIKEICNGDKETLKEWFIKSSSVPGALACYAGKKNHYVIGSDGNAYKCTVAFDQPDNQVGKIDLNGNLIIDQEKEKLWTGVNSSNDSSCKGCAFALSCMGIHCPLTRILTGENPCPTIKNFSHDIIEECL